MILTIPYTLFLPFPLFKKTKKQKNKKQKICDIIQSKCIRLKATWGVGVGVLTFQSKSDGECVEKGRKNHHHHRREKTSNGQCQKITWERKTLPFGRSPTRMAVKLEPLFFLFFFFFFRACGCTREGDDATTIVTHYYPKKKKKNGILHSLFSLLYSYV